MTKENPLNLVPGDEVVIFFDHQKDIGEFSVRITEVVERYRSNLIRFDPINPTDHKYFTDPVTPHFACDVHFVKRVTKRALRPIKPTIRSRPKLYHIEHHFIPGNRNNLFGSIPTLALCILESRGIDLKYGIDEDAAERLWNKSNCPGLLTERDRFWDLRLINRKSFTKWVLRNKHRLARSKTQFNKDERDFEIRMAEDYWRDVKYELEILQTEAF